MPIILETENLNIEPLNYEHEEILFDNLTAKAKNYMFPNGAKTKKDITVFIKKYLKNYEEQEDPENSDFMEYVILTKNNLEIIGTVGLTNLQSKNPTIGIWIFNLINNSSLAKEGINKIRTNFDFQHLIFEIEEENTPVRRFIDSIGGIIAKKYTKTDRYQQIHKMIQYKIPKI